MKYLTIITVCLNSEKTIEKCMDSVIGQLNEEVEYLIIDGKSKDRTLDLIKRKIRGNKNIKYVSEKDSGIYDAMNKGVKLSQGKWIYFLNSDDFLKKDIIKNIIKTIKLCNNNYDCICGKIEEVKKEKGNALVREVVPSKDLSIINKTMCIPHPGFFCKREIFYKNGFFDTNFKIAADWDFVIRTYKSGYKFYYIDKIISTFNYGGACSKSHIIERHKVRKKNKLYFLFDQYFYREILFSIRSKDGRFLNEIKEKLESVKII